MSDVIEIIHDSDAWHALRARHIGGSEIAALFDLPPEETPSYLRSRFALWHVKAGNAPPPHIDNPRVRWGLKLEAVIADAAAETYGWTVRKGGYVEDARCPGLGCTLDFIIDSDLDETGPGALEIKNVDWLVHKKSWETEPPPHILLQHQHQMAATGYTWGAVVALVGGNDLRCYRYRARPKLIEDIRRRVTDFWASIDAGQEPPVDGSESASAVLTALFPEVIDDNVDMRESNEWAEAAHALATRAAERKAADDAYDLAKNRIEHLLAGHKRGWGNGWAVNTAITPANPGKKITAEDIGNNYWRQEGKPALHSEGDDDMSVTTTAEPRDDRSVLRNQLTKMSGEFRMALPSHIAPDKFQRVVMTAVQQNPDILAADRRTLLMACTKCAQDGLLPDGREAALVVFNTKIKTDGREQWVKAVQYMPMIAGIKKRAMNSGQVSGLQGHVIYANDHFVWKQGTDPQLEHIPLFPGERGEPIGAYAVATIKGDDRPLFRVFDRNRIEKARAVSKSKDGPAWRVWWDEMAIKTVARNLAKDLPADAEADMMRVVGRDDEPVDTQESTATIDSVLTEDQRALPSRLDVIEGGLIENDPDLVTA